jgi:DNA replication protein DnaC
VTHHCWHHGTDYEASGICSYNVDRWTGEKGCPQCDEEYRSRLFAKRTREANLPPRFVSKTFADFQVSTASQKRALAVAQDYVARFSDHQAAGRCLIFCGKPGTGKTLLASIIATSLIQNLRIEYTTVAMLIRDLRSNWQNGGNEQDRLSKLQNLHLLILDEVGLSFGTDSEIQQLSEVIDLRYQVCRPTLVASNYGLNELGKFLGERAVDRLKDNGGLAVIFNWESHRK